MTLKKHISHTARCLLCLAAAVCVCLNLAAQTDYDRTAAKAKRFFDNQEWLNANAMYMLMLDERPLEVSTYSHAIVSNMMANDTTSMSMLLEMSMRNNVPFDSLLNCVQHVSMQVGSSDLYEQVLLTSRRHFSWLTRGINAYLLKYYDFRNNGPEIIRYAKIMLNGMPDDVTFKRQLARGYLIDNKPDAALQTWLEILEKNPDHYDTILDVGNYYESIGDHPRALPYLQHANTLHPSPYLNSLISN
jgi:tetratricopeptide (TPR) repeat protein